MTAIVLSTVSLTQAFRVLRPEDAPLLRAFLLSLSESQRRERFAGGISDHAIDRHCDDLNWQYYFAFGWISQAVIRSLVELYPVGGSWETAEVTATTSSDRYRFSLASMLEFSFSEARRMGCRHLVFVEPSQDEVFASMQRHRNLMIRDGKLMFSIEDL
jgi:hypothetical protein